MGCPSRRVVLTENKQGENHMTYREAKKLHSEDEIQVKSTGCFLHVISVEIQPRDVFIRATDGNLYHHTAVR